MAVELVKRALGFLLLSFPSLSLSLSLFLLCLLPLLFSIVAFFILSPLLLLLLLPSLFLFFSNTSTSVISRPSNSNDVIWLLPAAARRTKLTFHRLLSRYDATSRKRETEAREGGSGWKRVRQRESLENSRRSSRGFELRAVCRVQLARRERRPRPSKQTA